MEAGRHSLSPDTSWKSEAAPPPSSPAPPYGTLTKLLGKRKDKDRPFSFKRNHEDRSCSHQQRPSTTRQSMTSTQNSVTIVKSRGYSISRTPSHVEMNIDTTAFFDDDDDDQVESSLCFGPSHSKGQSRPSSGTLGDTLDTMTQQMEKMNMAHLDVQVELVETRRASEQDAKVHKDHTESLLTKFKEEKETVEQKHSEELSVIRKKNEDYVITLKSIHKENIINMRIAHEKEEAKLQEDIKFAERKHKIAMADVRKESASSNSRMKSRLQKEYKEELVMVENLLRKDSTEKMKELREELAQKHLDDLQEIDDKHQLEMENILDQFSKIHEVEEELEKTKKYVRKLERQSTRLKGEVKKAHSSQQEVDSQLLEAKTELELFKADFQRKISEAQSKTKDRLDELMLENIQVRKKHLAKSEELAKYRADVETSSAMAAHTYREKVRVMVKARSRANLSVALGLTEEAESDDTEPRPSSAPVTRTESSKARRHILSSEPKRSPRPRSRQARPRSCIIRPKSCLANL